MNVDHDSESDDPTSLRNWDVSQGSDSIGGAAEHKYQKYETNASPMKLDVQYRGGEKQAVSFDLEISVLGEPEKIQRNIEKGEFDRYDITLDCDEPIALNEFLSLFEITSMTEEGSAGLQINFGNTELIDARVDRKINDSDRKGGDDEGAADAEENSVSIDSKIPEPPHVDIIEGKENSRFYQRLLDGKDDQANTVRKLVYDAKEITKGELDERIEREGYSKSSSGVDTTLRVLERIGEIKRRHEGDSQKILWTGN